MSNRDNSTRCEKKKNMSSEGLQLLEKETDAVLVLDNRLLHFILNMPLTEAFSIMDQLIAEIVKGL